MKNTEESHSHIWSRTIFELKLGIPLDFTALSRTGGTPTIKLHVHPTCGSLEFCISFTGCVIWTSNWQVLCQVVLFPSILMPSLPQTPTSVECKLLSFDFH